MGHTIPKFHNALRCVPCTIEVNVFTFFLTLFERFSDNQQLMAKVVLAGSSNSGRKNIVHRLNEGHNYVMIKRPSIGIDFVCGHFFVWFFFFKIKARYTKDFYGTTLIMQLFTGNIDRYWNNFRRFLVHWNLRFCSENSSEQWVSRITLILQQYCSHLVH